MTLAVLTGLDSIVKGCLHLLRRLSVLNGHAHHLNASLVTVEHSLHGHLHGRGDFLLAFKEHRVHGLAADDFAHGRFGSVKYAAVRIAAAEKEVLGGMRLDAVLNVEHHVDDVFIVGKHQRFLKTLRRAAHTDLGLAHTRNVDDFDVLHGPGHAPVNAGCAVLRVLAECRHHTDLTFGNDVDAAGKPGNSSHAHEAGDAAHRK